ncbi:hypothetical protein BSL78_03552 [Apostichopus japonicus]|uniref:Uncharacterized protein n=1 Tax=Stichopus japonicus TaxID=307972 RepID=A0A2G8LH28_STIJA|nr:hypothetical protein BSL78_03552 [Apostichopus japonicus]
MCLSNMFGLAPHFKEELIKLLKNEDNYVVLFDESMNAVTQSKQLDVHVRAWNTNKLLVESRYYNSVFMGHGTAADMMMHFRDAVEGLEIPKIFQAGGEASSWGIEQLFSSAHWLFHDTPARREDFQKITGNTKFPLKFCKHRWLENVPVAERIQEILPDIAKYVKSAKAQQVSCPKTKSFEVIFEAMKDPLLEAKLAYFTLVAKEVYPFLVRYQTDKPMLPFLATDMHVVLKDIMKRFVKKDAIADVNRITKVVNMDVNSSAVQCPIGEVDIGFIARKKVKALLATKKISDRQSQQFKLDCQKFLVKLSCKLLEKAPITYQLVRCTVCIDPRRMASHQDDCEIKFKKILQHFVAAKVVKENQCDALIKEYSTFLEGVAHNPAKFRNLILAKTD